MTGASPDRTADACQDDAPRLDLAMNAALAATPATGVARVAFELLQALAALRREGVWRGTLRVVIPGGDAGARASARLAPILATTPGASLFSVGIGGGPLWEQTVLPLATRGRILLSPGNRGPLAVRRQLLIIHDAQVHLVPEAYTPAFRAFYRTLQPRLARRAARVATVSAFSARALEAAGVVPIGKARVVANGADHLDRVAPDRRILARLGLEETPFFLAVGSHAPHKNIATLASAASARPAGGPPVVVVGTSDARIFARTALDGPLVMAGWVGDGELRALYHAALALLFPSLTEGFGLPPLEAMRAGCPVVAARAGALPETCRDAALLIDPTDVDGWRGAMEHLATEPALREDLSARGRAHAAAFRWDRTAREILGILTEIAQEP